MSKNKKPFDAVDFGILGASLIASILSIGVVAASANFLWGGQENSATGHFLERFIK